MRLNLYLYSLLHDFMFKKIINTGLLFSLLGILLFGNLTESKTFQQTDTQETQLFALDLRGIDFLNEKGLEEFEIVHSSFYSYSKFRNMIMIMSGLIILMLLIQFITRPKLFLPLSYTILLIIASFVIGYIGEYTNFFFEMCSAKFPETTKTIDSKTPALGPMIIIGLIILVFNWSVFVMQNNSTRDS